MDSGTSGGSMQSGSSCGEDDQSVANSFSAAAAASVTHRHLLPHPQVYQQPIFSPQQHLQFPPLTSNLFFDPLPQSDLDRILSMPMNHPHPQQQQQQQQQQQMFCSNDAARSTALDPPQQKPPGKTTPSGKENGAGSSGRVVKKRTRASRKTPTTVLTTDTANFRAMVQEFTGIPTPPFGPSPFFPAKKFDLFAPDNNPSLTSLLYSLNKSTNPNPNPNPFAPPSNNAVNDAANFREQTQRADTMMTQGSNHGMFANPNLAASFQSPAPFSSSMYAARGSGGSGNEADRQLGGFSLGQNVPQRVKNTGGENDK
uniref:VQ domain-containing protein n=1 Tax=Kalanchoe fedtschenkoi TaxID=63787 RepID=A0A7N0UK23_KALFE